eukprot:4138277-Prymnesium_polylepis.1
MGAAVLAHLIESTQQRLILAQRHVDPLLVTELLPQRVRAVMRFRWHVRRDALEQEPFEGARRQVGVAEFGEGDVEESGQELVPVKA